MDAILASGITSFVTLVGIAVSYMLSRRNLREEVHRLQEQQTLAKTNDFPSRAASLLDDLSSGMNEVEMRRFLSDIYAYGSPEAIRILVAFQENNYEVAAGKVNQDPWYTMTLLSLLITQLKYDLTGRIVDPEYWFRIKLTDYDPEKHPAREKISSLVGQLGLDSRFVTR